jgi:hypothetical protein
MQPQGTSREFGEMVCHLFLIEGCEVFIDFRFQLDEHSRGTLFEAAVKFQFTEMVRWAIGQRPMNGGVYRAKPRSRKPRTATCLPRAATGAASSVLQAGALARPLSAL